MVSSVIWRCDNSSVLLYKVRIPACLRPRFELHKTYILWEKYIIAAVNLGDSAKSPLLMVYFGFCIRFAKSSNVWDRILHCKIRKTKASGRGGPVYAGETAVRRGPWAECSHFHRVGWSADGFIVHQLRLLHGEIVGSVLVINPPLFFSKIIAKIYLHILKGL